MSALAINLHRQHNTPVSAAGEVPNGYRVQNNRRRDMPVGAAPYRGGNPDHANPEQALAAALSRCRMMNFLALCTRPGGSLIGYRDHPEADPGRKVPRKMSITRTDPHPVLRSDTGFAIDADQLAQTQHREHRYCFIANSLADSVETRVN